MKNNKSLIYIAILSIAIAALIFIINLDRNKTINSKYLEKINYSQFNKLIEKKESFILYIGRKGCGHCEIFAPKFVDILEEYKIHANYIDLATYSKEEQDEVFSIVNISGTPNVAFIVNGEEQYTANRIDGNVSKEKIIEKLKLNDYIK